MGCCGRAMSPGRTRRPDAGPAWPSLLLVAPRLASLRPSPPVRMAAGAGRALHRRALPPARAATDLRRVGVAVLALTRRVQRAHLELPLVHHGVLLPLHPGAQDP